MTSPFISRSLVGRAGLNSVNCSVLIVLTVFEIKRPKQIPNKTVKKTTPLVENHRCYK